MSVITLPPVTRPGLPVRYLILLLLGFMLSACDPFVAEFARATFARLSVPETETSRKYDALCREEAGTRIYDTATNVRGILDESSIQFGCSFCESGLLKAGYDFVEYEVMDAVSPGIRRRTYVEENGLYRYTLEDAGHPDCRRFDEFYEGWRKAGNPIPAKYGGRCIATKRVATPRAKYKVKYVRIPDDYSQEQDRIRESRKLFLSLDESKLYGRHYSYYYRTISDYRGISSGVGFTYSCPNSDDADYLPPKPDTIFQPKGYRPTSKKP